MGMRHSVLGFDGLLLAVLLQGCRGAPPSPPAAEIAPTRPHIVMVLVDDLGWRDLEVPAGSPALAPLPNFRTPHALRLADEGVTFT